MEIATAHVHRRSHTRSRASLPSCPLRHLHLRVHFRLKIAYNSVYMVASSSSPTKLIEASARNARDRRSIFAQFMCRFALAPSLSLAARLSLFYSFARFFCVLVLPLLLARCLFCTCNLYTDFIDFLPPVLGFIAAAILSRCGVIYSAERSTSATRSNDNQMRAFSVVLERHRMRKLPRNAVRRRGSRSREEKKWHRRAMAIDEGRLLLLRLL